MRNIKFRGYSKYLESWVYGFGALEIEYKDGNKTIEIVDFNGENFFVKDESVGQYIGLKDKNGKEIYEGDILLSIEKSYPSSNPYFNYSCEQLREFCKYDEEADDYYQENHIYMEAKYNNDTAMFELADIHTDDIYNFYSDFETSDVEVVGNKYENKDLLEGGN